MYSNYSSPLDDFKETISSMFSFTGLEFSQIYLWAILLTFLFLNIPTIISLFRGKGAVTTVELFGESVISLVCFFTMLLTPYGVYNNWLSLKRSLA